MFWIDDNNKAHYAASYEDISLNDRKKNLSMMFEDHTVTDRYGEGKKMFIVQGAGRCRPGIRELVEADSLEICRQMFAEKHKQRFMENSLLCINYFEFA